jgi:hypothetical protein
MPLRIKSAISALVFLTTLEGCGGGGGAGGATGGPGSGSGGDSGPTPVGVTTSYGSTSSHGDFATWTISGTNVSAVWEKIHTDGTVAATFKISASCESEDVLFGDRACTITTSSTDVPSVLPPSVGTPLKLVEAVNSALFVFIDADAKSGLPSQLHIGILNDANGCTADLSGEYLYVHTGLGTKELFGLYAIDSNFESVRHAGFGMAGGSVKDASLGYVIDNSSVTGAHHLNTSSCKNGIQRIAFDGIESRLLRTHHGALVLDLAAGQGGNIAFHRAHAANLQDFANKRFTALRFGDSQGLPYDIAQLAGGDLIVNGDDQSVALTGTSQTDGSTGITLEPISNTAIQAKFVSPDSYQLNAALAEDIPDLRNVQGVFQISRQPGSRDAVIIAMKGANGKIIAFGSVFAASTQSCEDGDSSDAKLFNAGNFVFVER